MIRSSRRIARNFDNADPLVYGRDGNVEGKNIKAGDPMPDTMPHGVRLRLWLTGRAHTAAEFAHLMRVPHVVRDTVDLVTVTPGKAGWFTINAPWLDEPIKMRGADASEAKAQELRDAGPPIPEPVVFNPGDIITFDDVRAARIDAIDEDKAAVSLFDDDGSLISDMVPIADLAKADDAAVEAFNGQLRQMA